MGGTVKGVSDSTRKEKLGGREAVTGNDEQPRWRWENPDERRSGMTIFLERILLDNLSREEVNRYTLIKLWGTPPAERKVRKKAGRNGTQVTGRPVAKIRKRGRVGGYSVRP